ncbi:MAG: glycosyltransferase [Myxococcota bacterium]|nr:glycosyltransferase [Myxococcota bacterium]
MSLGRGHRQPGETPLLSVVIPSHEGSTDWLGDCVASVLAQDCPEVPEIVVVFDGDAPRASRLVRELAPAVRQLPLSRARGFAGAAAEGIRIARGNLVALLNDDATLEPSWITAMITASKEEPNAGSFASRIVSASEPELLDSAGHGLTRWGEAFAIGAGLPDGPAWDQARFVFGAPATAAVFRRELLRDCGGFDPSMEAYLEDVDLSLRAQIAGFPCLYVPEARVRHRGSASYGWGSSGTGRAERLASRNRIHLLLKSMPRNTLRASVPAILTSILADLTHRSLSRSHPTAALMGAVEGLRAARSSLGARAAALGHRRVSDDWIRQVLRDSELALVDLASEPEAGRWRRSRASLSGFLTSWVDRRELRQTRNTY